MPFKRFLCSPLRSSIALLVLGTALSACGQSSAPPTPVPTHAPVRLARAHVDARAVALARRFLRAFKRGDRRTMLRLMSDRLRRRNQRELVAQMLGVQNVPLGISIAGARSYHARWGSWTRVRAQLRFDHGIVSDQLGVTRTRAGYRVDTIKYLQASG